MKTLTGKAEKLFNEWYLENDSDFLLRCQGESDYAEYFEDLKFSYKWGVYLEFADSLGYELIAERHTDFAGTFTNLFNWEIYKIKNREGDIGIKDTRQEAQQSALDKLDEIINKI